MPAPATIDDFLVLIRKSGLVDLQRVENCLQRLRAAGCLPDQPMKLAEYLIQEGLLTYFHAEQFLIGKWRGFTIGKYDVLERLGVGGTGIVYLCHHRFMRRRVAIKVLATHMAEDQRILERFYREAQAVAALDHPNIVRAHDIDHDGALHFLIMEFVDGTSLDRLIRKLGPLDVPRACHYIRQAALGLQHAHEAGMVHRDIKPANLLLDRNGVVKILDMGLARFYEDHAGMVGHKDAILLGTADFLSPEQAIDSDHADIRADIYSLGGTFYYLLAGRPPFEAHSLAQKLICHQTQHPKPVSELRPDVPREVSALIEKMMAKDPAARPQVPVEVVEALAAWAQTPVVPPTIPESGRLSPLARRYGSPISGPGAALPTSPGSSSSLLRRAAPPPPLGAADSRKETPTDLSNLAERFRQETVKMTTATVADQKSGEPASTTNGLSAWSGGKVPATPARTSGPEVPAGAESTPGRPQAEPSTGAGGG